MLFPRESLGRFPDRDAPIPSSATSTNSSSSSQADRKTTFSSSHNPLQV